MRYCHSATWSVDGVAGIVCWMLQNWWWHTGSDYGARCLQWAAEFQFPDASQACIASCMFSTYSLLPTHVISFCTNTKVVLVLVSMHAVWAWLYRLSSVLVRLGPYLHTRDNMVPCSHVCYPQYWKLHMLFEQINYHSYILIPLQIIICLIFIQSFTARLIKNNCANKYSQT